MKNMHICHLVCLHMWRKISVRVPKTEWGVPCGVVWVSEHLEVRAEVWHFLQNILLNLGITYTQIIYCINAHGRCSPLPIGLNAYSVPGHWISSVTDPGHMLLPHLTQLLRVCESPLRREPADCPSDVTGPGLANFFSKEPLSEYPVSAVTTVHGHCNSKQHRQHAEEWVQLCFNNTLWINTEIWILCNFHVPWNIYIYFMYKYTV